MARNFVAASSQLLLTSSTPVTARPLSISCWFKPVAANVAYPFVAIDDGTANERYALLGSTGGTVRCASVHLGSTDVGATTATYSAGVWAQAGAWWSANQFQPFLNGVAPAAATSNRIASGISKVRIGATAGGGAFMNGDLAEVGLWNVVLAQADWTMLALGVSPLFVRRDALVGYWPLRHGYSPEIDLMSTTTAAVTGATVVAHPRVLTPARKQISLAGSTTPTPPTTTPVVIEQRSGGGRYRRPEPVRIPQQVIDDLEALYRTIYQGRKSLPAQTIREVSDLVGFFAESYDGRLPPPEAVHFRDMAEYPDIDLSALSRAADSLIARADTAVERQEDQVVPGWTVAAIREGEAVERAREKLKTDALKAARRAEEEEEEAIMALLISL